MKSSRLFLVANSYVKVVCSEPAKILLINEKYYDRFCRDSWADYHGGFFTNFPAIVEVPYDGIWNIIIDTHSNGDKEPSVSITILPNHKLLEQQEVIKE
ncbi:hypothetical protein CJD50_20960 [Hafnia paralvei]|uniref:DUF1883 domain-containing protein n=1 Tax=Hafnia paralvei TaxID=546367 RepID=A0A2A2M7Y0_9GAMM|nr:DUF1883 domain-containing protein [Hafnia paralvei]PAV94522.1 hypothetical protein CJD50_20960 [Hafnia paralvei]